MDGFGILRKFYYTWVGINLRSLTALIHDSDQQRLWQKEKAAMQRKLKEPVAFGSVS